MSFSCPCAVWTALLSIALPVVGAAEQAAAMKEDEDHVTRWNRYTDQLYALHSAQLAGRQVRQDVGVGGYAGRPRFYREQVFYDTGTGRRLSIVQRELDNPDAIHSISVFRHDARGRVVRDYSSTYLPDYRNAPTQTLAFEHHYPAGVHAYRAYDASGELLDERCEGEIDGRPVFITLDIDEIDAARGERDANGSGIMTTSEYRYCFQGLVDTAANVLPPH